MRWGPPKQVEPITKNFDFDDYYEYEETGEYTIYDDIIVDIEFKGDVYIIVDSGSYDIDKVLWTAVEWCRQYGVPGVNAERIIVDYEEKWRLGGLYLIAGYELIERELDYQKYGHRTWKPEEYNKDQSTAIVFHE